MDYRQTIEFLYSRLPAFHRIGRAAYKADLTTTMALDEHFDHPHRNFTTIHVAGTNGKGSVSHMAASVLQEAGFRTGLYTSPHLRDFRERIRIDGQMIPENMVTDFVLRHMPLFDRLKPSFFEMTVAMAFDYFAGERVDVAVIEVGLGGRLDSTNIITPAVSVITNIGHDHMDLLGDTPEKIAAEKAGIIKKSVPVIISETQPGVKEVFLQRADQAGSRITFADRRFKCTLSDVTAPDQERQYTVSDVIDKRMFSGSTFLAGDYQEKNIQAVYALFTHPDDKFSIAPEIVASGIRNVIRNTGLCGRWQILGREPLIVCDTAHNREGLEYVTRQIAGTPKTGLHMILGFVNDKDLDLVLPLFPKDAEYYFTRASMQRALDENILKAEARKYDLTGNSYPDVNGALKAAMKKAGRRDMIFIGGSTFVVAEVV